MPVSVLPPITAGPLTTVIDVAVELIDEASVVCWAFEEYFLVVIFYLSAVVDADWIERLLSLGFFV